MSSDWYVADFLSMTEYCSRSPFSGCRLKCASEDLEKSLSCVCRSKSKVLKGAKFRRVEFDTDTHTIAHALTVAVIRLSTNIIWVEWWVFSEMRLFPSHDWKQEGGGGGTGGGLVVVGREGGGCYWYAPCGANTWLISCRHSNACLLWLICTSCRLPTEHAHREQVNANELQTFKGTVGSKSNAFRGCLN